MNVHVTPEPADRGHAWLDVTCPWCWIAKRLFEADASEYGGDITVQYHSFGLAPDLPAD